MVALLCSEFLSIVSFLQLGEGSLPSYLCRVGLLHGFEAWLPLLVLIVWLPVRGCQWGGWASWLCLCWQWSCHVRGVWYLLRCFPCSGSMPRLEVVPCWAG